MIWVLLATLSFQCTVYMRSPSHLGRDSTRRMSGSRLLSTASSQLTWGPDPGSVDRYPALGILPVHASHIFNFYYGSDASVTSNWHHSSLFISFISATGQALCTTSHVQLVLSRMLWELVLSPDLIRKRLKLVIIKLCSGQAGLSLQFILCFPERRESS